MRSVAIALLGQFGSEALRNRLANYLGKSTTPDATRQTLLPTLSSVLPQNVAAQTILYRSEGLDKGNKAILEGYFIKYSSAALAALMKVPEQSPAQAATTPGATGPYGAPYGPSGPGGMRGPYPGPGAQNPPGGGQPPASYMPPGQPGRAQPPGGGAGAGPVRRGTSPERPSQSALALFAFQDPGVAPKGPRPSEPQGTSSDAPVMPGGPQPSPPSPAPWDAPGGTTLPPPTQPPGPGMAPGRPPAGPSGIPPGASYPRGPTGPGPYSSYSSANSGLNGPLESMPGFTRDVISGLAAPLWNAEFTNDLQARLQGLESLDADAPTVVLASTIPTDAVRAKLYRLFESHFDQGPQGLEAAGLAGTVFSDPGTIVTMKLLPRKETKPRGSGVPNLSRLRERRGNPRGNQPGGQPYGPSGQPNGPSGQPYGPGQPPGSGGSPYGQQPQQEQTTPSQEWNLTIERLLRATCERLAAAGKGRGSQALAEKRPVLVPPNDVQILAEYHLEWPADLADKDKLSGVSLDPMAIHYVRFQGKSTVNKVMAFYRRQLTRPTEHAVATGTWMESLRSTPESSRRLSVDVLITKAADMNQGGTAGRPGGAPPGYGPYGQPIGPSGPPGYGPSGPYGSGTRPGDAGGGRYGGQPNQRPEREKNEQADLVVEILAIEINDPSGKAQAASEEPEEAKEPAAKEEGKA